MSIHVTFSRRAAAHARAASAWWRENRGAAPDLFDHELESAIASLAVTPDIGAPYQPRPGLRRVLLQRTRYHLYYRHDEDSGEVVVLAVWSALRGRAPRLPGR